MSEVNYSYNVMYYDESYMEEPEVYVTFDYEDKDNEQEAYRYTCRCWESDHMYTERVVVE